MCLGPAAAAVDMREFMDYVHSSFYDATGWDRDNTYAALNATSDGTLALLNQLPETELTML